MYRASYCNAYINQREAQILVNSLYFFVKWLYMFRTNDSPKHVESFNEKIKIIHKKFVHLVGLYTHRYSSLHLFCYCYLIQFCRTTAII